jgi:phage baseplate assembly protein W
VIAMSDGFLGVGWAFPVLPDSSGGLRYAVGAASIQDCLLVLVQTAVGERVMRPDFGTDAPGLVFAPGSAANLRMLETSISDAIYAYEPRVELDSVVAEPTPGQENQVAVSVSYRIRRTNTKANLVFPYYLDSLGSDPG